MGLPQLLSPSCLRQGSLIHWLLWLTSEMAEFSCLCLPRARITRRLIYALHFIQIQALVIVLLSLYFEILPPSPRRCLLFSCISSLLSIQADKVICFFVCLFYVKPFGWQKWAARLPGFGSTGDGTWARKHTNNMLARNPKGKDAFAIRDSAQSQKEGT